MKELLSAQKPVYFNTGLKALKGIIKEHNYSKVFVLTDEHTSVHCLPVFQQMLDDFDQFDLIETSAGEECKTIDFCIGIWNTLIEFGADRKSLLINLGGGVITDMGGFIASTFKRGIDFINIPTSVLSQVDASVGGKTGIDLDHAKNMIGTFSLPVAVFIESEFLATLSSKEKLSGFAEMLKHGIIADKEYFHQLMGASAEEITATMIHRSVVLKNEIVEQDPQEKGIRKILNFGHTIGHAVESYALAHDKYPITHGEAISVGMMCEAHLSVINSSLPESERDIIVATLRKFYPYYAVRKETIAELISLMRTDKKNENGQMLFSLLTAIGACTFNCPVSEEAIMESFTYYNTLN